MYGKIIFNLKGPYLKKLQIKKYTKFNNEKVASQTISIVDGNR